MAAPPASLLDASQCIQGAYDDALGRIRVEGQATIVNGALEVAISSTTDNIAIRNTNNNNELLINSDGSINVSGTLSATITPPTGTYKSNYNEITSVSSGILTTLLTYTVPIGKTFYMNRIDVSGTNIAEYTLQFNSIINDKKRTYFGKLNESFNFTTSGTFNGFQVVTGTIITITTIHNRPFVGNFNARLQGIEI